MKKYVLTIYPTKKSELEELLSKMWDMAREEAKNSGNSDAYIVINTMDKLEHRNNLNVCLL